MHLTTLAKVRRKKGDLDDDIAAGSVTSTSRMNHIWIRQGKSQPRKGPVTSTLICLEKLKTPRCLLAWAQWWGGEPWNRQRVKFHEIILPPNLLSQLTARLEFFPESLDKPMFDVPLTWLTFKKAVPNSWQCFINFPPHKPHQIPLTPSNSPISKGPHPAEGWGSTWKSLSICHQLHLPLGSCSHRYLPNSLKCSSRMPYCFTSNNLPYHHRWASETPARSGNLNTNSRPKKPFGCWIWDMHQKPLMHRQESRPAQVTTPHLICTCKAVRVQHLGRSRPIYAK